MERTGLGLRFDAQLFLKEIATGLVLANGVGSLTPGRVEAHQGPVGGLTKGVEREEPQENIADVRAAVAANQMGLAGLGDLIARFSWSTVEAYMNHIRRAAAHQVRAAIAQMADGSYELNDQLDDGAPV